MACFLFVISLQIITVPLKVVSIAEPLQNRQDMAILNYSVRE